MKAWLSRIREGSEMEGSGEKEMVSVCWQLLAQHCGIFRFVGVNAIK